MKALFVGAGKRVTLAEIFKHAGFEIFAYETDINSPISSVANVIRGLRWSDENVVDHISNVISTGNYDLVLPFQDDATKILSDLKRSFRNICVSNPSTSNLCLDKKKFEQFFLNDPSLMCYYPNDTGGEVVIKPTRGYGSRGIRFEKKLTNSIEDCEVVQRRINGTEFSVDCYFDKSGKLIDFVPRERIEVVGGEVVKSKTLSKDAFGFDRVVAAIIDKVKFNGPICMQFIKDEKDNLFVMEINARFGGGCTLSINAGLDFVSLLRKEYVENSDIIEYTSIWKSNIYLSRAYRDHYYEKSGV